MRARTVAALVLLVVSALPPAVAASKKPKEAPPVAAATAPGAPDVVATIDDAPITAAELDRSAASALVKVRQQEYDVRMQALERMIQQKLVDAAAAREKVTPEQWLDAQVTKRLVAPTDAEIEAAYRQNKARLGEQTLEQARPALVNQLQSVQRQRARAQVVADLRAASKVKISLQPPRFTVDEAGAPSLGPKNAPVTILAFSDYQCPYCSRAEATMKQVRQVYGDKVRLVFRDFPLGFHAFAQKAAEAAGCANEQGKFWEMHDKLFANQTALKADDLVKYAGEIGLEPTAFKTCLDSGKRAEAIKKDIQDGGGYGVTGTPAFFVNGRFLSGAQPFDNFAKLIDDELTRAGIPVPPKPVATAPATAPVSAPAAVPTAAPAPAAPAPAPAAQPAR